jgi:hypothetical protein
MKGLGRLGNCCATVILELDCVVYVMHAVEVFEECLRHSGFWGQF